MNNNTPQLLVADQKGRIIDVPFLRACGAKGGNISLLEPADLIKLPPSSELFVLPGRMPVGFNPGTKNFHALNLNPLSEKPEKCFAVAAFIAPGYTVCHSSAYKEFGKAKTLPLFSYAAACFYKGDIYVSALKVDDDIRHDPCLMDINLVKNNAQKILRRFPENRLFKHLKNCALIYSCPNAKNLFLKRFEGPLPVSPRCNANCFGCISFQPDKKCPATQPRIKFAPTPGEIAEVALFHISNVKEAIVSFGQGCEGEPLLAGDAIEEAIRIIRKNTQKGVININTNASRPKTIAKLIDAGLNSMRVSVNSVREKYYTKYYKPRGYKFADVKESIKLAKKKGVFVSLNYLVMPGFTDMQDEYVALKAFIKKYKIDMIQLRNLNIDPLRYFKELGIGADPEKLIGIRQLITRLKHEFPALRLGYFNPSKI